MSSRPIQQFVKGQTIVLEGSQGDRSFRILSGEVLVCKRSNTDDLVPIARLGAGEFFGEMYLFDGALARSATVIAVSSEVTVEVYFQDEMESLMQRLHPAMSSILTGFNRRLRRTSDSCTEMYGQVRVSRLPDGSVRQTGTGLGR